MVEFTLIKIVEFTTFWRRTILANSDRNIRLTNHTVETCSDLSVKCVTFDTKVTRNLVCTFLCMQVQMVVFPKYRRKKDVERRRRRRWKTRTRRIRIKMRIKMRIKIEKRMRRKVSPFCNLLVTFLRPSFGCCNSHSKRTFTAFCCSRFLSKYFWHRVGTSVRLLDDQCSPSFRCSWFCISSLVTMTMSASFLFSLAIDPIKRTRFNVVVNCGQKGSRSRCNRE
jgi:hypothetical protein